MEIARFIGDNFQYSEFIYDTLEIEMPDKKKKKAKTDDDDEDSGDDIKEIAG